MSKMLDNKGIYDTDKTAYYTQIIGETIYESYINKRDFTAPEAWIKCREVKNFFYKQILFLLPRDEKYNLDIQIGKASVSITRRLRPLLLGRYSVL